jgi:hypothetical protein
MRVSKLFVSFFLLASFILFLIFFTRISGSLFISFSPYFTLLFLFFLFSLFIAIFGRERKEYGKGEEEYSRSEETVKVPSVKRKEYTLPSDSVGVSEYTPPSSVKVLRYRKASSPTHQSSSLETESYSRKEISKYAPSKDRSEYSPKVKEVRKGEELPPRTVHIIISKNALEYLHKVGELEPIIEMLVKDIGLYEFSNLQLEVVEEKGEFFTFEDVARLPYSPHSITIALTGKDFPKKMDEMFNYYPLGITFGTKIIVSLKRVIERLESLKNQYDRNLLYKPDFLSRLILHEMLHVCGEKEEIRSGKITDPLALYGPLTEEELELARKRLKDFFVSREK